MRRGEHRKIDSLRMCAIPFKMLVTVNHVKAYSKKSHCYNLGLSDVHIVHAATSVMCEMVTQNEEITIAI